MLSKQRHNMIVQMIRDLGSVQVKDLSARFAVTPDSIRKDLSLLQEKGLLKKTYGGAIAIKDEDQERLVSQRKGRYLADKQRLARRALALLKDGDVIFLDISTANIELAKMLSTSGLALTVVTNMIEVMLVMTRDVHNKLIFLGGSFGGGRGGFVGAVTNQQVAQYRFDFSFLGTVGVSLERNEVMTDMDDDAATKALVIRQSRKAYLMLESRKLLKEGTCVYATLADFTGVVLDKELPLGAQAWMDAHDLTVLAARNLTD